MYLTKIYSNDEKAYYHQTDICLVFNESNTFVSEHLSVSNYNFFTSTCCEQPTNFVLYTDSLPAYIIVMGNFYCSVKGLKGFS